MTEEPYRWVEAIANRREYIEGELASGSPIVAASYAGGILLLTIGRDRQKVFEIYDRIALGAIGHPGDIERLRLAAIEVASTEGFTRSALDVSLRRLAAYALSPALKSAFEQIYGAPSLTRLLFAELGRDGAPDLLLRLDYDGSFHTNGSPAAAHVESFSVIAGPSDAEKAMREYLQENLPAGAELPAAFAAAWHAIGRGLAPAGGSDGSGGDALRERLQNGFIEAAILDREVRSPVTYRPLTREETQTLSAPLLA